MTTPHSISDAQKALLQPLTQEPWPVDWDAINFYDTGDAGSDIEDATFYQAVLIPAGVSYRDGETETFTEEPLPLVWSSVDGWFQWTGEEALSVEEVDHDGADGPVQGLFWSVDDTATDRFDELVQMADALRGLPVCLVEWRHRFGLAMTQPGPGEQNSWYLGAAFVRLGYKLPLKLALDISYSNPHEGVIVLGADEAERVRKALVHSFHAVVSRVIEAEERLTSWPFPLI